VKKIVGETVTGPITTNSSSQDNSYITVPVGTGNLGIEIQNQEGCYGISELFGENRNPGVKRYVGQVKSWLKWMYCLEATGVSCPMQVDKGLNNQSDWYVPSKD